ncbi:WD40 repeat-containing protein MSI4-like protein [Tanacetum coccineum]
MLVGCAFVKYETKEQAVAEGLNGKHKMEIEKAHIADLHCFDWNPIDENFILTGSADNTVRFFDRRNKSHFNGLITLQIFYQSQSLAVLCVSYRQIISLQKFAEDGGLEQYGINKNGANDEAEGKKKKVKSRDMGVVPMQQLNHNIKNKEKLKAINTGVDLSIYLERWENHQEDGLRLYYLGNDEEEAKEETNRQELLLGGLDDKEEVNEEDGIKSTFTNKSEPIWLITLEEQEDEDDDEELTTNSGMNLHLGNESPIQLDNHLALVNLRWSLMSRSYYHMGKFDMALSMLKKTEETSLFQLLLSMNILRSRQSQFQVQDVAVFKGYRLSKVAENYLSLHNRLAEVLNVEVKRWSSGKQGNLRA